MGSAARRVVLTPAIEERFSALEADWSDQTFSTAASRPDRIASANA